MRVWNMCHCSFSLGATGFMGAASTPRIDAARGFLAEPSQGVTR
jgi:hypothetical protein